MENDENPDMVHIGQSAWDRLVRSVLAEADREVCGLLLGRREGCAIVVERVVPADNVAIDPRWRFEIEPEVVMRYLLDEVRSYSITECKHRCRVGYGDSEGSSGFETPRGLKPAARSVESILVGFYHSHPDGSMQPSRLDVESAWPGMAYLIVGVNGGRVRGCFCWQQRFDGPSMRRLPMRLSTNRTQSHRDDSILEPL